MIQEVRANPVIVLHCGQTRRLVKNIDQLSRFFWLKRFAIIVLSEWFVLPELRQVLDFFENHRSLEELHEMLQIEFGFFASSAMGHRKPNQVRRLVTHSLLECYRSNMRRAADPRDYVYARLGWSEGFMVLLLKPEYNTSTEDVFTSTTVKVLRRTQSWSHCHFFNPSASPFLPSWSIDFSNLGERDSQMSRSASFTMVKREFRSGSNAKFRLSNPRPGLLLTGGFVMDQVTAIAPFYCKILDAPCGPDKQGTDIEGTMVRLFEFVDGHQQYFTNNNKILSMRDVFGALKRALFVGCARSDDDFERNMRAIHDREEDYFRKHTGLAPPNIQIDDHIAILAGGCMPFAIRKVGEENVETQQHDTHMLIGACYIDGKLPLFLLSIPRTDADNSTLDIMHGGAVQRRVKEVYEAPKSLGSSSAGDLITDFRLHPHQIASDEPVDELAFLNDICLV